MFPCSNIHVMNAYVYNLCIREYVNNSPKENVQPPLPLPCPKIYPIIVPGLISYSNTSYFIIVLFDTFHVQESQFLALPISTSKHSLSFTTHFNSSETIMMQCIGLVSYILASIRLIHFGSPSKTAYFDVPLVSICAFFEFNYSFVTHCGVHIVPFLVTPLVSNFSRDYTLTWKRRLVCRYYPLRADGVFPPQYQKGTSL